MVAAGADVEDQRPEALPAERQFDRPVHVGHVGEVAALAAVAVDGDRLPGLDPSAEGLQGEVGPLAGSPDREEPQRDEVQAVELRVEDGGREKIAASVPKANVAENGPTPDTGNP